LKSKNEFRWAREENIFVAMNAMLVQIKKITDLELPCAWALEVYIAS
jgi:hypothetical protein